MGVVSDLDNAVAAVTSQLLKDGLAGAAMSFAAGAEAELARLRRMADLACKIAAHTRGARGVVFCHACKGSGLGIGIECVRHTATCDVAIHLDLPREKGEGE